LEAIGERSGKSLPTAFQDWANTKAAYRFFANGNVSEDKILEGHFATSALRIQATQGPILILQDTTEFSFKRSSPEKIGFTKVSTGHKRKDGRRQKHMICGLLMHASLAITPEGLPLGLTSAKFWSQDKFKGTTALKRKINPTRVPIEQKESMRWLDNLHRSTGLTGAPERCVHIGDRESDIFELYCLAQDLGANFLVRSCVDRLAEDGDTTIAQVMVGVPSSGTHEIAFRDAGGKAQQAVLSVKFTTTTVRPPIGKQKKYPHQLLQIIHAQELNPPTDRPAVFWKLKRFALNLNHPTLPEIKDFNVLDDVKCFRLNAKRYNHEPARRKPRRCRSQAGRVREALEHRDILQNLENGLSDRENPTHNSRSPHQLHCAMLCRGQENFVADHSAPPSPENDTRSGIHRNRAHPARAKDACQPKERHKGSRILHDRPCPPRRVFGPKQRSASWNNRHLAGLHAIVRPQRRISSRKNKQLKTCG
jgi:hypothetical protein